MNFKFSKIQFKNKLRNQIYITNEKYIIKNFK